MKPFLSISEPVTAPQPAVPPEPGVSDPAVSAEHAGSRSVSPVIDCEEPAVEITRGPYAGVTIRLRRGITLLGREHDSDIMLAEPTVSRRHATFTRYGTHTALHDCGSLNGTYLNGRLIDWVMLVDGDEIQVGLTRLRFHAAREVSPVRPRSLQAWPSRGPEQAHAE